MFTLEGKPNSSTVMANDPKVLEFLRYLGVDPELAIEVTITIESGQLVIVDEHRRVRRVTVERRD